MDKQNADTFTFDELYKGVVNVLVSGTKAQQNKMWKRLNEAEDALAWVKMKIIVDTIKSMDVKRLEQMEVSLMEGHVKKGYFVKMKEVFQDNDTGVKYRQYKRVDGIIYRVPYLTEGMDKYAYQTADKKKFLGDYIEQHSSGENTTFIPLDTPEKVKDYNDGVFYEKHVYKRNKPQ